MRRFVKLSILLTIITQFLSAQEIQFGFGSGIGTYIMSDLKNLNNKISKGTSFETKTVSDFPPYWYYRPSLILKGTNFGFGLCYNFESTGSRISSKDYSGEYRFDMKINANTPCIYAEYDIPLFNNFKVGFYSLAGLVFTNLTMNEYLRVNDSTLTNSTYKFDVFNEILEPGIEINYKIMFIGLKLNVGYLFQAKDDAFSNDQTGNSNINLNTVKSNWNGYRIGLSIFYNLAFKAKKEKINSDIK